MKAIFGNLAAKVFDVPNYACSKMKQKKYAFSTPTSIGKKKNIDSLSQNGNTPRTSLIPLIQNSINKQRTS